MPKQSPADRAKAARDRMRRERNDAVRRADDAEVKITAIRGLVAAGHITGEAAELIRVALTVDAALVASVKREDVR